MNFSSLKIFSLTIVSESSLAFRIGITGNNLIRTVIINNSQAKEDIVIAHSSQVGYVM